MYSAKSIYVSCIPSTYTLKGIYNKYESCMHNNIFIYTYMFKYKLKNEKIKYMYMYVYVHMYTAVLGIKQTFTYATVCLLVRSCCLIQRYQSKSLNEISPNPMGLRDRQSTLRFEKSVSAV
jgi:hypothetical protein